MRICFGLSSVLIDIDESKIDIVTVRPGALDLLTHLKDLGHTLILWTRRDKAFVKNLNYTNADLVGVFAEVYTKKDIELIQDIPGYSPHSFKDVRLVKADFLVEAKPIYKAYAKSFGMDDKYLIVPDFRKENYQEPSKWKVRVLGEEVIGSWKSRVKEKESWIYGILDKIEESR